MRWSRCVLLVGSLGATSLSVAACSGKDLSLGSSTVSQAIDPGLVGEAAGACPTGYAHPNVCCAENSTGVARCDVYPNAPFLACPKTSSTLPDPRSCCPLDPSAGACISVDAGATPPPRDSGSSQCVYTCPLGWFPPAIPATSANGSGEGTLIANTASVGCCTTDSNGNAACAYPVDQCPTTPQAVCPCPAIVVNADGSTSGPACNCATPASSSCTLPPAPTSPVCDLCPTGWQVPSGEPGLCCKTESDSVIECFSQAVPPPVPPPVSPPPGGTVDGGPPTEVDAAGPLPALDAAAGTCNTASDCNGALPLVCELCPDGGTGCGQFSCVNNQCVVTYCQ